LSHAIVAVSRHTWDHLVTDEGTAPEKVHVILNGIDFSRARISGQDAVAKLRRELAVENGHMLLVPARLHPEKGHAHLFQALPSIRKGVARHVVVLLAGSGPFEAAYREQVRALGCDDIVRFLGFRRDVADLMAAADLVVLPSVAEAFGLGLAEALYLGTPVVATRVGGIPEIVDDGVDGVLVPPADSRALGDAIVGLLTDGPRRQRLAAAGRERIRTRFSFAQMTSSYEELYERLLPESWSPSR
jgi:glycosyltransferase involved in cell wall biosynthesis